MKRRLSALSLFLLALGALATQSCESTDGQNSYYNRSRDGYYHDGRYAEENGNYHDGRYTEENGYYHERGYNRDDFQSDPPGIDVHFRPVYLQ
jgi:hypothetical protein